MHARTFPQIGSRGSRTASGPVPERNAAFCAGSPTAMLLAQRGHRVLLVDRATFPSDTVSTHVLHPRAGAALQRCGLLDAVVATGCPPVTTYHLDFGQRRA